MSFDKKDKGFTPLLQEAPVFRPGRNGVSRIYQKKPRPSGRGVTGFTLMEIIVSLFILSIVLTIIYTTFHSGLQAYEYVESRKEVYNSARYILDRLNKELSSAYLINYGEKIEEGAVITTAFVGEDNEKDGRPMDRINFTTLSHSIIPLDMEDNNQSEHSEVGYFWAKDYENDIIYLYRREDYTIDDKPLEGGASYEVAQRVKEFQLRYYYKDSSGYNWAYEWNSLESGTLPLAVEITISIGDKFGKEKKFSTLAKLYMAK